MTVVSLLQPLVKRYSSKEDYNNDVQTIGNNICLSSSIWGSHYEDISIEGDPQGARHVSIGIFIFADEGERGHAAVYLSPLWML